MPGGTILVETSGPTQYIRPCSAVFKGAWMWVAALGWVDITPMHPQRFKCRVRMKECTKVHDLDSLCIVRAVWPTFSGLTDQCWPELRCRPHHVERARQWESGRAFNPRVTASTFAVNTIRNQLLLVVVDAVGDQAGSLPFCDNTLPRGGSTWVVGPSMRQSAKLVQQSLRKTSMRNQSIARPRRCPAVVEKGLPIRHDEHQSK